MTTFNLSRPVVLPSGAAFKYVEVHPVTAGHLARIGDDVRVVTGHFLAAAEAAKKGEPPALAGSAEYASMVAIIRELSSLGDDAEKLDAADLDGLVTAILFQDDATPGEL